jgi:hypothetical protein
MSSVQKYERFEILMAVRCYVLVLGCDAVSTPR